MGTVGVFFDACRRQELKREGSGRHSESEAFFGRFWGLPQVAQEGFSLQRELCFHLDDQWQRMSNFGSILESFWEPQAQLYSRWCLPESIFGGKVGVPLYRRFPVDFKAGRIPGHGQVDGNLGALGPLILNPTDCQRRQDTGYKMTPARDPKPGWAYRTGWSQTGVGLPNGLRRRKSGAPKIQNFGFSTKSQKHEFSLGSHIFLLILSADFELGAECLPSAGLPLPGSGLKRRLVSLGFDLVL